MATPDPNSVAELRKRFIAQINAIREANQNIADSFKSNEQRNWHKVDKNEWDGNLFSFADLNKPFDRSENEDDVNEAIRDAEQSGVVGDLIVSSIQGDYLACMERAFRLRHQLPIRSAAHAASRRQGHAHDAGLFERGIKGYIENLLKTSKDK